MAWLRCDTPEQAVAWLDRELDLAAAEMRYEVVTSGLDDAQQSAAMQLAYVHLDRARERGLAEIEKAFARLERERTLH